MAKISVDQLAAEIAKGLAEYSQGLLDEKGIEYSERQTKAELIALLGGG